MRQPEVCWIEKIETPIGRVVAVHNDEERLLALEFEDFNNRLNKWMRRWGLEEPAPVATPSSAREAIEAYFEGDFAALARVEVAAVGTPFQQRVWDALREIPVGSSVSYSALAARIGHRKAVRAVGAANGANPVAIVVPCHRVVGARGDLTGYGGGIERKRWLLRHEGALGPESDQRAGLSPS